MTIHMETLSFCNACIYIDVIKQRYALTKTLTQKQKDQLNNIIDKYPDLATSCKIILDNE